MERALARSRDRFEDPRPSRRRIRLMIVDDSTVARAVLSRMVESDPAFEICAVAGTAEDAIEAGADEYVMKPFDRETLEGKLQLVGVA